MTLNQNGLGNPSIARIPRPYVLHDKLLGTTI